MSTPFTINSRDFFKIAGALALAAAVLAPLAIAQEAIGQEPGTIRKPNILLIYADDLGWGDVGYQNEGLFLTPNIDRLAQEGVVFPNAYSCGANCAPSPASLLSGGYNPRHRLMGNGLDRGPKNHQRLVPMSTNRGLLGSFVTVAEALKEAGYATGHFGKWHLAQGIGTLPSEQGFDVTYNSFGEGPEKEGWQGDKAGPPSDPKGIYTLTDKAVEFMAANRTRPFFVYLSHHAIHTPLQTRPETRQLIAERASAAGVGETYMGCVYDLDDSMGRLLAKLRELELEKNTLVVFASDNGAWRGPEPGPGMPERTQRCLL